MHDDLGVEEAERVIRAPLRLGCRFRVTSGDFMGVVLPNSHLRVEMWALGEAGDAFRACRYVWLCRGT
jgi:hypothetical protein